MLENDNQDRIIHSKNKPQKYFIVTVQYILIISSLLLSAFMFHFIKKLDVIGFVLLLILLPAFVMFISLYLLSIDCRYEIQGNKFVIIESGLFKYKTEYEIDGISEIDHIYDDVFRLGRITTFLIGYNEKTYSYRFFELKEQSIITRKYRNIENKIWSFSRKKIGISFPMTLSILNIIGNTFLIIKTVSNILKNC